MAPTTPTEFCEGGQITDPHGFVDGSRQTAFRWLHRPHVQEEVEQALWPVPSDYRYHSLEGPVSAIFQRPELHEHAFQLPTEHGGPASIHSNWAASEERRDLGVGWWVRGGDIGDTVSEMVQSKAHVL